MSEHGGDPACWMDRVCPACDAVVEDDAESHDCDAGSTPVARVQEAIELCEGHDLDDFVGSRSAKFVNAAEAALGVRLPASYRHFVERLGAGDVDGVEIYGVISEPFDGPVPDAVWATLEGRRSPSSMPATMVVVGDDGMGGRYVLDTAKGAEPPVEVWVGGASSAGEPLEQLAPDFGSFLLGEVRRAVDES